MPAKLELQNVAYYYGKGTAFEVKALDSVNFKVQSGSITGLIGHTGSGKSTLAMLFNGLEKPYEGKVLLDGCDIWDKKYKGVRICFRVGLVMQYPEYQLFEETVFNDVAFGPRNMGLDEGEVKQRVYNAIRFVGLSDDILTQSPFDLSGGHKRRVAIAGIMAMQPELLVLDEPAAGLDPAGRSEIFGGIRRYRDTTGATVLIVSHSMEDMAEYCDDIIVMHKGKVMLTGAKDEIFADSQALIDAGLDIPQITRVMRLLAQNGLAVNAAACTKEQALAELVKVFKLN
ncbi:MAG: energy-coupling factor transporter ATPase [Clostridia bacterium]|nr:energy-coupling factor transporter ATPase [Clostridia bacterium]